MKIKQKNKKQKYLSRQQFSDNGYVMKSKSNQQQKQKQKQTGLYNDIWMNQTNNFKFLEEKNLIFEFERLKKKNTNTVLPSSEKEWKYFIKDF